MSLLSLTATPDLTERVYAALQQAICSGDLAPGARVTQEELADQLAVSRQPVLQALRMLKRDGFLVEAPVKGAGRNAAARGARGLMVTPLQAEDIRQIYQVRAVLDGLAAREAAQVKARISVELIDTGRRAASAQSIADMIDADATFHEAIYAASGNRFIAEAAQRHWYPIRRAMGAVLRFTGVRESVWDEHAAILKAIARGDATRAEQLSRDHGERAGQVLAQRIEINFSSPAQPAPVKETS